jgi:uncharacterized membrane protein YgcG
MAPRYHDAACRCGPHGGYRNRCDVSDEAEHRTKGSVVRPEPDAPDVGDSDVGDSPPARGTGAVAGAADAARGARGAVDVGDSAGDSDTDADDADPPPSAAPCGEYSRGELLRAPQALMEPPRRGRRGPWVCTVCGHAAHVHTGREDEAATAAKAGAAGAVDKERKKDVTFDARKLIEAGGQLEPMDFLRAVKATDSGSTDFVGDPNLSGFPLSETPRRELLVDFWDRQAAWAGCVSWVARNMNQVAATARDQKLASIRWCEVSANAKPDATPISIATLAAMGMFLTDAALGLATVARIDARTYPAAALASKLAVPYAALGPVSWLTYLRNTDLDTLRRWFTRLATDGPRETLWTTAKAAYLSSPAAMWAVTGHTVAAAGHVELEAPAQFWQRFHAEDSRRRLALRDIYPDRTTAADAEMEVETLHRRMLAAGGSAIGKRVRGGRGGGSSGGDKIATGGGGGGGGGANAKATAESAKKKARLAQSAAPGSAAVATASQAARKKVASDKLAEDRGRDDCIALRACFKCKQSGHAKSACTAAAVGITID